MANSDKVYRSIVTFFQFFRKGWGPVDTYERLAKTLSSPRLDRNICKRIVADHSHTVHSRKVSEDKSGFLYEGSFLSPLATYLPGVLPEAAEIVRFELLVPKRWKTNSKPVYIHLAGTGDHYFWRRKLLFGYPLLRNHGMGSLLIENPYYGTRKPSYQTRSQIHHVSDLFLMGLALIFECMVVSNWIESMGMGPVGLTGVSMGGYNVSLTASLWPKPVVVVPCLSWATGSSVFTEGAFSSAVCWDVLEEQLHRSMTYDGDNQRMKDIFNFVRETQTERLNDGRMNVERNTYSSPCFPNTENLRMKIKNSRTNQKEMFQPGRDTVQMLRWILDYTTHLASYPVPISPELALFIIAKDDMYVPRNGVSDVRDLWPGCEVKTVGGGHISSHLIYRSEIIKAQAESMEKFLLSQQTTTPVINSTC